MGATARTDNFIGMTDAVKRYRISIMTIKKKVDAGLLQTYVHPWDGRRRMLRVDELEALLDGPPQVAQPLRRSVRP
jgi:hypothetical protein